MEGAVQAAVQAAIKAAVVSLKDGTLDADSATRAAVAAVSKQMEEVLVPTIQDMAKRIQVLEAVVDRIRVGTCGERDAFGYSSRGAVRIQADGIAMNGVLVTIREQLFLATAKSLPQRPACVSVREVQPMWQVHSFGMDAK
jgi:hypothetical protein